MKTAQRPPSNRAEVKFQKKDGVHYCMGHELPEDVTCGDGPIDKLLDRGYEIVAQRGRKVIMAISEEEYNAKIKNAQIESDNRLRAKEHRKESVVAGKFDNVSTSIDGVERPVESVKEIIESLPDRVTKDEE